MTDMLIIAAAVFGVSAGSILGLLIGTRHTELECEKAYLTGHVDGYRKAQDDSGEVNA
jgi:hypothetical protein